MIATCRFSCSAELADHQRGRFNVDEEHAVTPGKDYLVVGMGVWETIVQVLIRNDNDLPSWCPVGLFEVPPQSLPAWWMSALYDGVRASGTELWTRWVIRWGYAELVAEDRHSDMLMERDPEAIAVFDREFRRLAQFHRLG